MKTQDPSNRIRPAFVAMAGCVLAAILLPIWWNTKSESVPPAISDPPPATDDVPVARVRPIPDNWQRVTPPARGTAVSVRSLATQRAAHAPSKGRPDRVTPQAAKTAPTVEERWGIRVYSASLSMGNAFLDLRYYIVDLNKAARLAKGTTPAYVLDTGTGTKLPLPAPPKEGCFPPTGTRLATERLYFATIGNVGGVLKSGSTVNVVVGDSVATNVTID